MLSWHSSQVYGGCCYIDFGGLKHQSSKPESPPFQCTPLDPQLLPPLYLCWADSPSESGKVSWLLWDDP